MLDTWIDITYNSALSFLLSNKMLYIFVWIFEGIFFYTNAPSDLYHIFRLLLKQFPDTIIVFALIFDVSN